ncbi:MAG TPA: hypothetical protein VF668_09315 [Pyrinomonadaceae bacterium]|jgi:opacity protein-like surface antigen
MRTFILSVIILLAAAGPAAAAAARQDEPRRLLDPNLVPAEGGSARDFLPRGWKVEGDAGEVRGDLNGDGAQDVALRLVEDLPLENAEGVLNTRHRALVVLFGKPGGGYRRAAVAAKLLGCTLCHGVLGDPEGGNIQVEIRNGVLNVNQLSGSREATDRTQRFRYDAAAGRFRLIGEDVSEYDRAAGGGRSTSTNYLTGVRVTRTSRGGGRGATAAPRTTRVPRAARFIEDVDYENQ